MYGTICKLDNFLYDIKQDSKKWNEIFDNLMMSNDFKVNESDKYETKFLTT